MASRKPPAGKYLPLDSGKAFKNAMPSKSLGRIKHIKGQLYYSYNLKGFTSPGKNPVLKAFLDQARTIGQIASRIADAKRGRMEGMAATTIDTLIYKRAISKDQATQEYIQFQRGLIAHILNPKTPAPHLESPKFGYEDDPFAAFTSEKLNDWLGE